MWHWDLNWIFTTPQSDGKGTFLTPDTSNKFTKAMLAYPEIKEMFFRRLRTLADQFLVAPRYENQWDAIAAPYLSDWTLENQKWGGYTPASARSSFVNGLTDRRNVIANNTGAGKPVPASQSAAPNVVINEIQYNPAAGGDGEFIELRNPSTTESVDLSGLDDRRHRPHHPAGHRPPARARTSCSSRTTSCSARSTAGRTGSSAVSTPATSPTRARPSRSARARGWSTRSPTRRTPRGRPRRTARALRSS